jgi:uncharacterized phage protein (TIGR02218 family)
MRNLPKEFSGGAMTLASCWRLTRADGLILGFTDHDADLQCDGTLFSARSAVAAADMTSASGFEVTGGEISGALSSLAITESDIASGLYDNAKIDVFLVDWSNPEIYMLMSSGVIGEIKRSGGEFIVEIRGLASLYQEEKGRLYQFSCSADLGDRFCKIDLSLPQYHHRCTVTATDGRIYLECDADPSLYTLTNGQIRFLTGGNSGQTFAIKSQSANSSRSGLWLWSPTPSVIEIGNDVDVVVGCDKSFATCRTRFANHVNFRGFPHMPGNDVIVSVAKNGDSNLDGGSLFNA